MCVIQECYHYTSLGCNIRILLSCLCGVGLLINRQTRSNGRGRSSKRENSVLGASVEEGAVMGAGIGRLGCS